MRESGFRMLPSSSTTMPNICRADAAAQRELVGQDERRTRRALVALDVAIFLLRREGAPACARALARSRVLQRLPRR